MVEVIKLMVVCDRGSCSIVEMLDRRIFFMLDLGRLGDTGLHKRVVRVYDD
jgi:hypothetical protein